MTHARYAGRPVALPDCLPFLCVRHIMGVAVISVVGLIDCLDTDPADAVRQWHRRHPDAQVITAPLSEDWPFRHPLSDPLPTSPVIVWMPEVDAAFVNHQTGGTRLVTTQATYLLQTWIDAAAGRSVLWVATADRTSLGRHAPDALVSRPPFHHPNLVLSLQNHGKAKDLSADQLLPRAFRLDDPAERLRLCVQALDRHRDAATLVAAASACMEVNDFEAAARDLDEALVQAPEWAAAHFERGKLWLRVDDMERASNAFRSAAERMPAYAPAWANLGATLGELDRPEEALAAFEHALAADPDSHQALNNIGVVNRELGRLAESEAAFRRVITLAPDLAVGHYNLGHTLFLQGRYQLALSAYVEGQKRDPERNPVQATRLALCRLATGDAAGSVSELQRATASLPREYRRQVLADTHAIAWALLTHRPDLAQFAAVNDWLTAELARL
jgi:tetratricopeptide (TPR) repeat protein